ncbi:DUF3784 domain-containing protein [Bacillus sp. JRC01]|nr:DUF3784 domain-containing protein [Bacillus sp. JRC01]
MKFSAILMGSLICFLFSYLIGYKKMLFLIIGYKDELFLGDKDRLSKRVGVIAFLLGIITLLLPLGVELLGNIVINIYAFIVFILVLLTMVIYKLPYFNVK